MNEYRFTFGIKYREEPHPTCMWATPDGWLAVIAPNRDIACRLAAAIVGHADNNPNAPYAYAFDYAPEDWSKVMRSGHTWDETYPAGELARVIYTITINPR